MKKYLNSFVLVLAIACGAAAADSFLFHTGIAQSLSRIDKIIYSLFAVIPFSVLFHLILSTVLRLQERKTSLVIVALALLLGLGMTVFLYPEIKPVKQHNIIVTLPGGATSDKGTSLTITAAEIHDHAVQVLTLSQLHGTGNFVAEKDVIILFPDSSVSIAAQYSGNLHIYLLPARCPMPVSLSVDGSSSEIDVCEVNPSIGLTFGEEDSGSLTPRWVTLLKLLKGFDFVLFSLLAAGALLALRWLVIAIRAARVPIGGAGTKKGLRFLLSSALVLVLVTAVVLLANLLSVVLLAPLLVFLAMDFLHIYFAPQKSHYFFLYTAILASFITGTAFNVSAHSVYRQYLKPFPPLVRDGTNSFNALAISVFNGFDNSLLYGYETILNGRELIISNETIRLMDPDMELLKSRLMLQRLREKDFEPEITPEDFAFLLTQDHSVWNDGRGYQYYFTTATAFQPGEAVIIRQYQNWIILLPVSVNERLAGEK